MPAGGWVKCSQVFRKLFVTVTLTHDKRDFFLLLRSGVESATSEVSWEAVDEREARPTLWVPDHAERS